MLEALQSPISHSDREHERSYPPHWSRPGSLRGLLACFSPPRSLHVATETPEVLQTRCHLSTSLLLFPHLEMVFPRYHIVCSLTSPSHYPNSSFSERPSHHSLYIAAPSPHSLFCLLCCLSLPSTYHYLIHCVLYLFTFCLLPPK